VYIFLIFIQYSFGIPSQSSKTIRRNKREIEKEEVKLSLFVDDMILYLKNSKNSAKKLLDIINTFSKVAVYKINTQKLVAFLYTNNEQTEIEIREIVPLIIASKNI
jgi:hypothetical protein